MLLWVTSWSVLDPRPCGPFCEDEPLGSHPSFVAAVLWRSLASPSFSLLFMEVTSVNGAIYHLDIVLKGIHLSLFAGESLDDEMTKLYGFAQR